MLTGGIPTMVPAAANNDGKRKADGVKDRILVVDDNKDAADSLTMILMLKGHEARTANDGPTAITLGAEFLPRVIILDLGMPGLNGYDTARHIRTTPWGKDTLLIALTGWGQPEDKQRCIDAGFDFHLTKPVEPDELAQLLADNV